MTAIAEWEHSIDDDGNPVHRIVVRGPWHNTCANLPPIAAYPVQIVDQLVTVALTTTVTPEAATVFAVAWSHLDPSERALHALRVVAGTVDL